MCTQKQTKRTGRDLRVVAAHNKEPRAFSGGDTSIARAVGEGAAGARRWAPGGAAVGEGAAWARRSAPGGAAVGEGAAGARRSAPGGAAVGEGAAWARRRAPGGAAVGEGAAWARRSAPGGAAVGEGAAWARRWAPGGAAVGEGAAGARRRAPGGAPTTRSPHAGRRQINGLVKDAAAPPVAAISGDNGTGAVWRHLAWNVTGLWARVARVAGTGWEHWRIQEGGQPGDWLGNRDWPCPPNAQEGGHNVYCPPQQKLPKSFIFFKNEFGSIPKNSGLNLWSSQFWGTLGWDLVPSPPPPLNPAAGLANGWESSGTFLSEKDITRLRRYPK